MSRRVAIMMCCLLLAGCSAADARSAVDATRKVVGDASATAAAELLRAGIANGLVDGRLPVERIQSIATAYDFAVSVTWADADADGFVDAGTLPVVVLDKQFCITYTPPPAHVRPGPCTA